MELRLVDPKGDLEQIKELHQKFFPDHEFFDFFTGFMSSFVVEEKGEIVTIGGVRAISEMIALSNLNLSPRLRKTAYLNLLQACMFTANHMHYDKLHIFADGENWNHILRKIGFENCKGNALFVKV